MFLNFKKSETWTHRFRTPRYTSSSDAWTFVCVSLSLFSAPAFCLIHISAMTLLFTIFVILGQQNKSYTKATATFHPKCPASLCVPFTSGFLGVWGSTRFITLDLKNKKNKTKTLFFQYKFRPVSQIWLSLILFQFPQLKIYALLLKS